MNPNRTESQAIGQLRRLDPTQHVCYSFDGHVCADCGFPVSDRDVRSPLAWLRMQLGDIAVSMQNRQGWSGQWLLNMAQLSAACHLVESLVEIAHGVATASDEEEFDYWQRKALVVGEEYADGDPRLARYE